MILERRHLASASSRIANMGIGNRLANDSIVALGITLPRTPSRAYAGGPTGPSQSSRCCAMEGAAQRELRDPPMDYLHKLALICTKGKFR